MLGLLNSHVDPPNSLLLLCVYVFCLRGSGSEPPSPPTPHYMYTHTHLAGRSSGAPHSCQRAQPARFITASEFCIWGHCVGQKEILTSWVTSCFTVPPDHSIFMVRFKFWPCTWIPPGDQGRRRNPFQSQASVSAQCPHLPEKRARF